MNVTLYPVPHLPANLYGRLGLAIVRRFSLAIGVTGTEALANTFSLDPLGSVQWRFVMAADHPLANVEEPLTEAQLRRFPAVNIEDSARTLTKRVAAIAGAKEIIVPDMETKIAAHLAGVGIGFCQNHFASQ
ncbi:hypothetical protein FA039_05080 [Escherichia coli]|nr:hypothetical protein [Escherichia coli]